MNATVAKSFGWLQFAVQTLATVLANGVPHTLAAWSGLVVSIVTAIGVHAAASTDGAK
jgi:hypothetical protein